MFVRVRGNMSIKVLFCFLLPVSVVFGANEVNSSRPAFRPSKYLPLNTTLDNKNETSTVKYPTATWSARHYEETISKQDAAKLYLFKPSPFLKPPFTDGEVGASISGIEDGINVSGRRKGKIKWKTSYRNVDQLSDESNSIDMTTTASPPTTTLSFIDQLLEQSLARYLESTNLTTILGHISVQEFSETLKRITQEKRQRYDKNKELRQKFRTEMLSPKKVESKPHAGILAKQYMRRLQKSWEIINENATNSFQMPTVEQMINSTATVDGKFDVNDERMDMLDTQETGGLVNQRGLWGIGKSNNYVEAEENWKQPKDDNLKNVVDTTDNWKMMETTSMGVPTTSTIDSIDDIYITTSAYTTEEPPMSTTTEDRQRVYRGSKKWRDTKLESDLENYLSLNEVKNTDDGETNRKEDGVLQLTVAETVYYQPRERPLNTFTYEQERFGAIPGEPEKDYPMLSSIPRTGFKCPENINDGPVMMADPKTRCQVFYVCSAKGPPSAMLCPNGTVFNEEVLVCDWWFNVDC